MEAASIIRQLKSHQLVFEGLFSGLSPEEYRWKSQPRSWNLLQLLCHLYDEERDDFRYRVFHCLETPEKQLPPFDPEQWVIDRKYEEQDYEEKLAALLAEREFSVEKLQALKNPNWDSAVEHPRMGPLSAGFFLANWLEHDHLHIRQFLKIRHLYLQSHSGHDLSYAGNW